MVEFIKDNIVTVLSLILTGVLTVKSFKNEVIKNKLSITAEAMIKLPYEICEIMNQINLGKTMPLEKVSEILSNVLCYGSKDAVNIAVKMQTSIYSMEYNKDKQIRYDALSSYSLLITQIKYDLTSEIISPESWFKLKLPDYSKDRHEIISSINKVIDELKLKEEFKVKS